MPSDASLAAALDVGLLSPVTVGHDADTSDAAVLWAMLEVEARYVRALAGRGLAPSEAADAVAAAAREDYDIAALAEAAVDGGNPVIPLVGLLRARAGAGAEWVHKGLTSQDVIDSALMLVARRTAALIDVDLRRALAALSTLAGEHRDTVAVARTLGRHSVPTTIGRRLAARALAISDARGRLAAVAAALPAQIGGASGTLASLVELFGADAERIPAAVAAELDLQTPLLPWHTMRTPITVLGDALAAVTDALGATASDVITGSRSEIGELSEAGGEGRGGSSAMPQKQNPVLSVLIRSAALRAPSLAGDLHRFAADAVDERPVGAWHAEWPVLRELLRLTRGAAARAAELAEGLEVDTDAVARTLAEAGPLIVSERVMLRLAPLIGRARVQQLIAESLAGEPLGELLAADTEVAASGVDLADLLDPAAYTGLAGSHTDAVREELTRRGDLS